jgi:pimeloyl-ACP methyl ester carboxylesterase
MKKILLLTLLWLAHSVFVSAQSYVDKYVVVGDQKMYYQTAGKGVSVVFENGHTDLMGSWNTVFPAVSQFAKVVRYNRKGYGLSEAPDKPRTLSQIANELHEMLVTAKIAPPYVLVGHSMGGAVIRAFAHLYKTETAGLVFVDPFHELGANGFQMDVLKAELKKTDSTLLGGPPTYLAEARLLIGELLNGFPEMNSFSPLPDVPTVFILAGKNRPPNWEKNGIEYYDKKLRSLSNVTLIVLPQGNHNIMSYDPMTIIQSIRRVVFPDAEAFLRKMLKEKGVDTGILKYREIIKKYPKDLARERWLNSMGYDALNNGNTKAAIKLFSLNVELYPGSSNVYDSLGEAYMKAGDAAHAIINYERSLKLDPSNINAASMLEKLKNK